MLVKEAAQRAIVCPLQLFQIRPTLQQSAYQRHGLILEPLQYLRKVQLQASGQTVALPRLFIHHQPPLFHQPLQQARLGCVRLQAP